MTARTSAAAGDYHTAGNWSPSGVPVAGDTVRIIHAMTYAADIIIGASGINGTTAMDIDGGSLTTSSVGLKITHRGNIVMQNAAGALLHIGAGGQLIHDSSLAAAPSTTHYEVQSFSGAYLQFDSTVVNPCKWTRAAGSGTAGSYTHPSGFGRYPRGNYVEVLDLTDASTPVFHNMSLGGSSQTNSRWIFDANGTVDDGTLDVSGGGLMEWAQMTILNPKGTFALAEPYTAGAASAVYKLTDCVIDGVVQTANPTGIEWYNVAVTKLPSWGGTSAKRRRFERVVMIVQDAQGNSGMTYEGDPTDMLHAIEDESAGHNPHWGGVNQYHDQAFLRCKWEFGGGAAAVGDGPTFGPTDYGGHTYSFTNCIGPSGSGDFSVGKFINIQSAQNINCTIDHCTHLGDFTQTGECALVEFGETVSFRSTAIVSYTNSLIIAPTTNGGCLLDRAGDATWQDVVTAANMHHNGTVNGKSAAEGTGLVQGTAGSDLFTVAGANANGVHLTGSLSQVVVDHTRNLKSWAASRGFAGTYAGAKAALLAAFEWRSGKTVDAGATPYAAVQWVMDGWKLTGTLGSTLSTAGVSGTYMGAMPYLAGGPANNPLLVGKYPLVIPGRGLRV